MQTVRLVLRNCPVPECCLSVAEKPKNKGGRPRKVLSAASVQQLAQLGSTNEEIASVLECSSDTLTRHYSDSLAKGRNNGKVSLRRWQVMAAKNGDKTMLIWLGKQWLQQRDQPGIDPESAQETARAIRDALEKIDAKMATE
jgi:hypothetical protein